jgi:hypothetical protein
VTGEQLATFAINSPHIYFTRATPEGASVFRLPRGGGTATAFAPSLQSVGRLALDADNLYGLTGGGVAKMPLSGDTPVELMVGLDTPMLLAVGASNVYVSTYQNGIYRIPIAGGTGDKAASSAQATEVRNLFTDDQNLYWTSTDLGGSIMKMPLGGDSSSVFMLTSGLIGVYNFDAIAAGGSAMYFVHLPAGRDPEVARVNSADGAVTPIAPVDGYSIDVDDDGIYVADHHTIVQISFDGTIITTLAEDTSQVFGVEADGDELFWWTNNGDLRVTSKAP